MQKSLTYREVLAARRKNSMMLAVLFAMITASLVFAFGTSILYVIAVFALPVVLVRIWEEVTRQYLAQKPQNTQKTS